MTTYKEIRGTQIEAVSSDPSNPIDGQVWYNTTDNELKGNKSYSAAWATGGTLNTARYVLAGAGTQTLGLAFGGETPPHTANTEKYNGSSWTEVNNLNTSRQELSGGGTQTSALAFGGRKPAIANETESWNGTNWTEVNDLNTARGNNDGGAGTYTAALWAGGDSPPASPINVALTESWNGTNWTEVNDLNQGRQSAAMIGATNTASICFGGVDPSSGPIGSIDVLNELWNGTNWTESGDLSTGRFQLSGAGSSSSGLAFGGRTPTVVGNTEEWNDGPVVSTFTDS